MLILEIFASVNTYALNKTQAQVWVLEKCGDDVYYIRSNGDTNLTLDVLNWDTTNGNSLQLYHYNEGSQKFVIKENEDGTYCIMPEHAQNKCLDVDVPTDKLAKYGIFQE